MLIKRKLAESLRVLTEPVAFLDLHKYMVPSSTQKVAAEGWDQKCQRNSLLRSTGFGYPKRFYLPVFSSISPEIQYGMRTIIQGQVIARKTLLFYCFIRDYLERRGAGSLLESGKCGKETLESSDWGMDIFPEKKKVRLAGIETWKMCPKNWRSDL